MRRVVGSRDAVGSVLMSVVELPDQADVVIVGGGTIGTNAAHFLATETDIDILLVERDRTAGGSRGTRRPPCGTTTAIRRYTRRWRGGVTSSTATSRRTPARRSRTDALPWYSYPAEDDDPAEVKRIQAGYDVLNSPDIPVSRYEGDQMSGRYPVARTNRVDFAVSDNDSGYFEAPTPRADWHGPPRTLERRS